MIEFTNANIRLAQSNSLIITYPRQVQITCGTYPVTEDINNFMLLIKNNITEKDSYASNVKGGKTEWNFFKEHPLFLKFLNHLINLHQNTNPSCFEYFYDKHTIKNAWGNEIKKGDFVGEHTHSSYHGILYLTDGGAPLMVPELGIKITPKTGEYYIFPPLIYHFVPESTEDKLRYNLIFNIDPKEDWDKEKRLYEKNRTNS